MNGGRVGLKIRGGIPWYRRELTWGNEVDPNALAFPIASSSEAAKMFPRSGAWIGANAGDKPALGLSTLGFV